MPQCQCGRGGRERGHLEFFQSSLRILAVLLVGTWVYIIICISELGIALNAAGFVVQPFPPVSPPMCPQAFEQRASGTLKSGVESV